jgi:hypothetical protein
MAQSLVRTWIENQWTLKKVNDKFFLIEYVGLNAAGKRKIKRVGEVQAVAAHKETHLIGVSSWIYFVHCVLCSPAFITTFTLHSVTNTLVFLRCE